eukprot:scaffold481_cov63-Attheya_sp.AAC.3
MGLWSVLSCPDEPVSGAELTGFIKRKGVVKRTDRNSRKIQGFIRRCEDVPDVPVPACFRLGSLEYYWMSDFMMLGLFPWD